jgi:hypothetical protein
MKSRLERLSVPLPSLARVLAASCLFGCATNPATGIAASGQPLGINTETEGIAWRERQKVAEIQYVDAAGNNAGSASLYETRVVNAIKLHWWPTQGGAVIDDQDFFRIARDDRAVAEIEDYRTRAKWLNRVGFGLFALGAGGIAYSEHRDAESTTMRTIGGVGVLAALTGALWIYYGYYRTRSDDHVMGLERAREAANRYNATLKPAGGSAQPQSP